VGMRSRAASAVLAIGIAVVAGALVSASPASAAPLGCKGTPSYGPPGAYKYLCTGGGTGYARAVAYCSNTPGGWGIYRYGPWMGAGTNAPSWAYCEEPYQYLVNGYGERKG